MAYFAVAMTFFVLCFIVISEQKLEAKESQVRYYCNQIGFTDLYIDKTTDPYIYYCLDLPAFGVQGYIFMLPPVKDMGGSL